MQRLFGMDMATKTAIEPGQKKFDGFQNFSNRMTTGIALASGGAVLGAILGPVGATVGALASGVVGSLVSGSHNDSKARN